MPMSSRPAHPEAYEARTRGQHSLELECMASIPEDAGVLVSGTINIRGRRNALVGLQA